VYAGVTRLQESLTACWGGQTAKMVERLPAYRQMAGPDPGPHDGRPPQLSCARGVESMAGLAGGIVGELGLNRPGNVQAGESNARPLGRAGGIRFAAFLDAFTDTLRPTRAYRRWRAAWWSAPPR